MKITASERLIIRFVIAKHRETRKFLRKWEAILENTNMRPTRARTIAFDTDIEQ